MLLSPALRDSTCISLDSFEQVAAYDLGLTDFLEDLSVCVCPQAPQPSAAEGSNSFWAAMNHLNPHCSQPLSLRAIAEELHLNVSCISQLIKNETGLTYAQYIAELRIGKAKEMLMNTKLPPAEISESVYRI